MSNEMLKKKLVKIYMPTCPVFAGQVTYIVVLPRLIQLIFQTCDIFAKI